MIAGVADTHAALWYLHKNPRLSVKARTFIDEAASAGHDIALSPICRAEIVYLVERQRPPPTGYEELRDALADPEYVIREAPFTVGVVEALRQVPRADVPDMPDRIVAATAVYLQVPVISRDGRIRASNIHTVW